MPSDEGACRSALRTFAITFPPLKLALYINDIICYLFGKLIDGIKYTVAGGLKLLRYLFILTFSLVSWLCTWLLKQLLRIEFVRKISQYRPYRRLELTDHGRPVPYANSLIKRLFTYHGGLLLALALYIFVYFVLVSRHTYLVISIAIVLLLAYLILIENSHTFRSILMLSLPIMFTNRGRALIYCSMLAIMATGPIETLKQNIREIHSSLICCKQYLILSTDRKMDDNYVKKLVRVEDAILDLVTNIKQYAKDLKTKFSTIIELAVACEQFIIDAIDVLKGIVNVCNIHTRDMYANCIVRINTMARNCHVLMEPFRFNLCTITTNLGDICSSSKMPDQLCRLPIEVADYIERTLGAKLRQYIQAVENEFYFDIDIERKYAYNVTMSKGYDEVVHEIQFDVEQKFWYIRLISRLVHFLTLALVLFILATAAFYHMHYQTDLAYDNMYLDDSLLEIDALRQLRHRLRVNRSKDRATVKELISIEDETNASLSVSFLNADVNNNLIPEQRVPTPESRSFGEDEDDDDDDRRSIIDQFDPLNEANTATLRSREEILSDETLADKSNLVAEQELGSNLHNKPVDREQRAQDTKQQEPRSGSLFPLSKRHERRYLYQSSWAMNHVEKSKLKWSSVIWLIIVGYIWLFVLLDFAFYSLVAFLVEILRDILFTSDLPLVNLESKSSIETNGSQAIVRYNRTYLASLRKQQQIDRLTMDDLRQGNLSSHKPVGSNSNSSIQALYRRLVDSIEHDIPDDIAILDSLEECLPKAHVPAYATYRKLLWLAILTFVAVIIEAYALRTRHCIANLYYPNRARLRSVWLYKRLLSEQAKYAEEPETKEVLAFEANKRAR